MALLSGFPSLKPQPETPTNLIPGAKYTAHPRRSLKASWMNIQVVGWGGLPHNMRSAWQRPAVPLDGNFLPYLRIPIKMPLQVIERVILTKRDASWNPDLIAARRGPHWYVGPTNTWAEVEGDAGEETAHTCTTAFDTRCCGSATALGASNSGDTTTSPRRTSSLKKLGASTDNTWIYLSKQSHREKTPLLLLSAE